MNDIGATGQAFIDTLFAQLHGFRFIRLLQRRTLTGVDDRIVTSGPITHFVTTQLFLINKSGRIHTKTLDLFLTKLGQYPIILGLLWFRKYLPHIWFDKNIVIFDSLHYLQHCSLSHQAITVSGLDTSFDNCLHLPTLSDQAMNVSNADDFVLNLRPRSLSYHCCHLRLSPHETVNVFSIDKPIDRRSCSMSSSTSSQTPVSIDTPRIHNPRLCYSYNSCHRFDMVDSLKTINQELLRPKDWVSPTVLNSKNEFAELLTMDISMIGASSFNTLV